MIIPPFRLYHFAVKLIWKRMLVLTLSFWVGLITVYYIVNNTAIWNGYRWWLLLLMIAGTYFLFMDVKLMLIIMRHEEKKKWKRYRLKNDFKI